MTPASLILAVREIRRRPMRAALTVLGVVIGTFAVVTLVTLGDGAAVAIRGSISALGSDILQVRPGQSAGPGGGGAAEVAPPFKLADLDAIRSEIAGAVHVAGLSQAQGLAVRNAANWTTTITGTTNDYFRAQKWTIAQGRMFSVDEEQAGQSVCVVGATLVANLFPDEAPVGQVFRVHGVACEVIGVLARRGQGGFGADQDDVVVMPLRTVMRRIAGNQDIAAIMIGLDPAFDSGTVERSVSALLRERRHLPPEKRDDFTVLDAKQITDTITGTVRILTLLIASVAAISLLVGGIGIMNVMLASVNERTREIGIRLAIGATSRDVLLQFLIESAALAALGGLAGLALALAASLALAPLIGAPFRFHPGVNLAVFAFTTAVGVAFGYGPARRAARLDPIEALRHD